MSSEMRTARYGRLARVRLETREKWYTTLHGWAKIQGVLRQGGLTKEEYAQQGIDKLQIHARLRQRMFSHSVPQAYKFVESRRRGNVELTTYKRVPVPLTGECPYVCIALMFRDDPSLRQPHARR